MSRSIRIEECTEQLRLSLTSKSKPRQCNVRAWAMRPNWHASMDTCYMHAYSKTKVIISTGESYHHGHLAACRYARRSCLLATTLYTSDARWGHPQVPGHKFRLTTYTSTMKLRYDITDTLPLLSMHMPSINHVHRWGRTARRALPEQWSCSSNGTVDRWGRGSRLHPYLSYSFIYIEEVKRRRRRRPRAA
jgi:hypothetical protein